MKNKSIDIRAIINLHFLYPSVEVKLKQLSLDYVSEVKIRKVLGKTSFEALQLKALEYFYAMRNAIAFVSSSSRGTIDAFNEADVSDNCDWTTSNY